MIEKFNMNIGIEECPNGNVAIQIQLPGGQFTARQIEYGRRIQEVLKRELPAIGRALGGKGCHVLPQGPALPELNRGGAETRSGD
jgi:hypothetical protein